jgi:hypothetical protein
VSAGDEERAREQSNVTSSHRAGFYSRSQ